MKYVYRKNWLTDAAIMLALHKVLTHLDKKNTYVRMLFINYSSAFNAIIPSKLNAKLENLELNTPVQLDFGLSDKQTPSIEKWYYNSYFTTLALSMGAPQGCVFSPLLYSLFTHYCVAMQSSNIISLLKIPPSWVS